MNDREREMWVTALEFMRLVDHRLERLERAMFGAKNMMGYNWNADKMEPASPHLNPNAPLATHPPHEVTSPLDVD